MAVLGLFQSSAKDRGRALQLNHDTHLDFALVLRAWGLYCISRAYGGGQWSSTQGFSYGYDGFQAYANAMGSYAWLLLKGAACKGLGKGVGGYADEKAELKLACTCSCFLEKSASSLERIPSLPAGIAMCSYTWQISKDLAKIPRIR